ncbi:hypothetical protein [Bacillus sp. FJAT-26390]|uniref:hypothetical protein n=1 Tax=Bacillus sp. FJAT-26390 TaxID=1743142 RepID=UPI000807AC2A|nr:hypothetical protein [Bacillus sp. FJAT-26390]OBZ11102.1 hypothetical protein A7975_19210 [Bacillus sp. FJAT-26390]
MNYHFSVCATANYQEKYIEFLLLNYEHLKLGYSFPVSLSYLSSPIFMEREAILVLDDEQNVIGAVGYIHGTGEQHYEDIHIVQIQVLFLLEKYRRSRLFLHVLQFLAQHLAQLKEPPLELRFWATDRTGLEKIIARFAMKMSATHTDYGINTQYQADFKSFYAFAMAYPHERYY